MLNKDDTWLNSSDKGNKQPTQSRLYFPLIIRRAVQIFGILSSQKLSYEILCKKYTLLFDDLHFLFVIFHPSSEFDYKMEITLLLLMRIFFRLGWMPYALRIVF